jgi:hypothetical protein
MKQRLLLFTLGIAGILGTIISTLWLLVSIVFDPYGSRAMKIIKADDMLVNVATGGELGEYVTTRAYQASLQGNRWGCWLCRFLDWLQPNHCENSAK